MPGQRRSGSRLGSTRGQRTPTNWGGTVATTFTSVAASTKVLLGSFVPQYVSGETIRRLRGTFWITSTSTVGFHGAVGAYVAGTNAVLAGVASLIDPVTDVSDDAWMWYRSFSGQGTAVAASPTSSMQLEIDSKAMRRLETGQELAIVVANASASTTFAVALSVRALGSESR